ncbi:MAG: hypothetical protein O3B73_15895 [bacterium]|nr:hypothetical protein [bacterium]
MLGLPGGNGLDESETRTTYSWKKVESLLSAFWIALVFGSVTLVTMMAVVSAASLGLEKLPIKPIERFSRVLAGFAICLCGIAVRSGF